MDKVSIVLSSLLGLVMVLWIAPSVMALNRGKMLRNVALWLGIILALALFYRQFGPGRTAGLSASESALIKSVGTNKDEDYAPAGATDADPITETYTPPQE